MYNHLETTKQCFDYIRKYTNLNEVEIIAVNNGSQDGTTEWLKQQTDITKVIHHEVNIGLTKGYNSGIKAAVGKEILILANDILLTPNWLENLRACLYHQENVGIVVPIMNQSSSYQSIPVEYSSLEDMETFANSINHLNPLAWQSRTRLVTCCCFAKKEMLELLGGFDEIYGGGGSFSDDDLTLSAAEKGYKNFLCYDTFVHHFGSQTISEGLQKNIQEGRTKFKEKWGFDAWNKSGTNAMVYGFIEIIKNKSGTCLEVGTGLGGATGIIKHMFPDLKYTGYEKGFKEAEIAGKAFSVLQTSSYQSIPSGKKFQYVYLNGLLQEEELDRKELEYTLKLVTSGGLLFGIFENKQYLYHLDQNRKNVFSEDEIKQLFSKKGYKHVSIIPNRGQLSNKELPIGQEESKRRGINFETISTPSYIVLAVK